MKMFLSVLLAALSSVILLRAQPEAPTRASAIALTNADLGTVLRLYSDYTGRTLLLHPKLSRTTFNLSKESATPTEARSLIEEALREKGIATIADGDKFIIVAPQAVVSTIKPAAPGQEAVTEKSADALIPPGMANMGGASENQILALYADLLGKKLDTAEPLPQTQSPAIHFRTVTPLSKQEMIYAVKTLLTWRGIDVVPVGDNAVKAVRVPDTK